MGDDKETKVLNVEAGCSDCSGDDVKWTTSNAMAVAARHATLHNHRTWVRQTIEVRYGGSPPKQTTYLPGFEPVPAAGTTSAG